MIFGEEKEIHQKITINYSGKIHSKLFSPSKNNKETKNTKITFPLEQTLFFHHSGG